MTKSLDELLQEIEARAESATPGPWETDGDAHSYNGESYATTWVVTPREMWMPSGLNITADEMCQQQEDADFIAQARTDIPKMAAVIRKLIQQRNEWIDDFGAFEDEIKERHNAELAKIWEGWK